MFKLEILDIHMNQQLFIWHFFMFLQMSLLHSFTAPPPTHHYLEPIKHCFHKPFSCQATLLSPQCCLVSTHLTSLEWREICALPQPPPSWCGSRCPPVTLGSSLVMMDSASPLTRDATRYHTAGNSHTFIEKDLSFAYAETNPMKMGVKC